MTPARETPFQPTRAFKNPHLQSFLASAGPRRLVVQNAPPNCLQRPSRTYSIAATACVSWATTTPVPTPGAAW